MIRRAKLSDIEEIYKMGSVLHANYSVVNNLEQMLTDSFYKIFVAEVENKLVGFLSVLELQETVDIIDFFVLENYRKNHIGSQLLNYMIGDVSSTVKLFTLEVATDNQVAMKLYQRFGFEVVSTRESYYGDKDAYLMGLRCIRDE